MTGPPTRVRRLHDAAVDPLTPMWRGAAVFRVLTFAFVLGVQLTFSADYARPGLSWVLVGLIGVWTVVTVWAFSVADGRRVWLAVADVAVVTALMASTLLVQTPEQVADPTPTITTLWSANPVVTAAVLAGARVGTAVGALVAAISLLVNGHITTSLARDSVILLLLGAVLGVVADTARRSHAALAQALRAEAALVEREHLARAVHDSVLQVLAFVRREGATLGGPGAELARLAGDQEIALRALVATPAREGAHGEVDLRALLQEQANPVVSVSVPGTPVPLPAAVAVELAAVAGAALSNTALTPGSRPGRSCCWRTSATRSCSASATTGSASPPAGWPRRKHRAVSGWPARSGVGFATSVGAYGWSPPPAPEPSGRAWGQRDDCRQLPHVA